ncbi:hypothetical protein M0802_001165 [Mischocyttarus mexicanus]|nr:hypothetical protein M0802_001165 [Mischocyttarus mexicanus]
MPLRTLRRDLWQMSLKEPVYGYSWHAGFNRSLEKLWNSMRERQDSRVWDKDGRRVEREEEEEDEEEEEEEEEEDDYDDDDDEEEVKVEAVAEAEAKAELKATTVLEDGVKEEEEEEKKRGKRAGIEAKNDALTPSCSFVLFRTLPSPIIVPSSSFGLLRDPTRFLFAALALPVMLVVTPCGLQQKTTSVVVVGDEDEDGNDVDVDVDPTLRRCRIQYYRELSL